MNIKVFNEKGTSNGYPARRWFDGNPVKLYVLNHTTTQIYATAIHELAHVAHWRLIVDAPNSNRNRDYNLADDRMCESWARGVEWYLTKMVYPTYYGGSTVRPKYTQFVVDLIDSDSETANYGYSYNDGAKVNGYTIVQIQNTLIGCSNHIQWKTNIINMYNNKHAQYVDALFNLWY